jgi:hypothetical protein
MISRPPMPARLLVAALFALLGAAPLAAQAGAAGGGARRDGAGYGAGAAAQERSFFPAIHYFESPLADLREPRMGGALIGTDLFAAASARERPIFEFPRGDDPSLDVQGLVALGTNIPVWRLVATPHGGMLLGFQVGVHARFRLEQPSRDMVGSDWVVALPFEMAHRHWSARVRLLHRSAHLGDELAEKTGAQRIEYSHEALDALAAYRIGNAVRVYGGGTYVFRSVTEAERLIAVPGFRDEVSLQAGFEAVARAPAEGRLAPLVALDWQRAQRTGWDDEVSAALGVTTYAGGRRFSLLLRYFNGPSTMGEFFLTPESFWGLEFTGDL